MKSSYLHTGFYFLLMISLHGCISHNWISTIGKKSELPKNELIRDQNKAMKKISAIELKLDSIKRIKQSDSVASIKNKTDQSNLQEIGSWKDPYFTNSAVSDSIDAIDSNIVNNDIKRSTFQFRIKDLEVQRTEMIGDIGEAKTNKEIEQIYMRLEQMDELEAILGKDVANTYKKEGEVSNSIGFVLDNTKLFKKLLPFSLFFDDGKFQLNYRSKSSIKTYNDTIAFNVNGIIHNYLKHHPKATWIVSIKVDGYSDPQGIYSDGTPSQIEVYKNLKRIADSLHADYSSETLNFILSEQRAKAVLQSNMYNVNNGTITTTMEAIGHGIAIPEVNEKQIREMLSIYDHPRKNIRDMPERRICVLTVLIYIFTNGNAKGGRN